MLLNKTIVKYSFSIHLMARVLLVFIGCPAGAQAQSFFKGVILNKLDSTVIPYAAVTAKESGSATLTDINGAFHFALPKNTKQITLSIAAIGSKTEVTFQAPFNKTELIYLDIYANPLNEVAIKALSAEEIVKIAVASIPQNYADSNYFDYSFYRRYQKLNGRFVNLYEAAHVVMFRLIKDKSRITANEAYAVNQLRRSEQNHNIMNVQEDNPADLLLENPVYHLQASSLNPDKFNDFIFNFDTTHKSKDYVITYYSNNFTSDHHGFGDYDLRDLKQEAYETGEMVIDRETYAIKKIHRKSLRHKDYHYKFLFPQNNRVLYRNHYYYFEFVDGDLEAVYAQHNGKWYLDKICRQYTNEFILGGFETKEYSINDNFEWQSDSVSRYTTGDFVNKFFPRMSTAIHNYDTSYWIRDNHPFYYSGKEAIYKDLLKDGPIDKQFYKETLIDEIRKPVRKKAGK